MRPRRAKIVCVLLGPVRCSYRPLRFLLGSAVQSAAGGLVEQRIMTAFAAIEHLMWTRLVTVGGMSKTKYEHKDFNAPREAREGAW